jgi:hypothetical protein
MFQRKLDQLLVNFRSETMQEFLTAKKSLGIEQAQAIDGERRRCNTMLGLKQTELETLRENLAHKSKQAEEYSIRCEIMAVWCSKGRTIGRV